MLGYGVFAVYGLNATVSSATASNSDGSFIAALALNMFLVNTQKQG